MPELKEFVLEDVLERHLGQVAAPEELWRRVNAGTSRARDSRLVSRRMVWTLAAAMLVGGAAWELHPRAAGLRSGDATQIREWVKSRTDLDVPLHDSPAVRLMGAHATNRAAEIAYRAGDRDGTLAVVRASTGADNHITAVNEARSGANPISWTMRGQAFTLACDDHAACLLCHS